MNEFDCYTTEIYCVINIIFTVNFHLYFIIKLFITSDRNGNFETKNM